jgi:hypothetical protein
MVQRCHGAGFAFETVAELAGGNFHCYGAVKAGVCCSVHLSHPARAYKREDFVRSEPGSSGKRHINLSDFTPPNPFMADSA